MFLVTGLAWTLFGQIRPLVTMEPTARTATAAVAKRGTWRNQAGFSEIAMAG